MGQSHCEKARSRTLSRFGVTAKHIGIFPAPGRLLCGYPVHGVPPNFRKLTNPLLPVRQRRGSRLAPSVRRPGACQRPSSPISIRSTLAALRKRPNTRAVMSSTAFASNSANCLSQASPDRASKPSWRKSNHTPRELAQGAARRCQNSHALRSHRG